MDDLTDTHHISRLEAVDTIAAVDCRPQKRCGLNFSGPRLASAASATARRHGISNQLLFAWRNAYREGQLGDICDIPRFVSAMIVPEQPEKRSGLGGSRIEIVSANGRCFIVDCLETLLRERCFAPILRRAAEFGRCEPVDGIGSHIWSTI